MASLAIVPPLYILSITVIQWMGENDPATPTEILIPLATAIAILVSGLMVALGVLTAHRVAGPHINLQRTFETIAEGDFDRRLKFRTEDKLDEVEGAFNTMMDTLQGRIKELEAQLDQSSQGGDAESSDEPA